MKKKSASQRAFYQHQHKRKEGSSVRAPGGPFAKGRRELSKSRTYINPLSKAAAGPTTTTNAAAVPAASSKGSSGPGRLSSQYTHARTHAWRSKPAEKIARTYFFTPAPARASLLVLLVRELLPRAHPTMPLVPRLARPRAPVGVRQRAQREDQRVPGAASRAPSRRARLMREDEGGRERDALAHGPEVQEQSQVLAFPARAARGVGSIGQSIRSQRTRRVAWGLTPGRTSSRTSAGHGRSPVSKHAHGEAGHAPRRARARRACTRRGRAPRRRSRPGRRSRGARRAWCRLRGT